jgi:hypothetical protein
LTGEEIIRRFQSFQTLTDQFTETCCTSAAQTIFFQPLDRTGHHARHRLDVAPLHRLIVFMAQDRLNHLVWDSEFHAGSWLSDGDKRASLSTLGRLL